MQSQLLKILKPTIALVLFTSFALGIFDLRPAKADEKHPLSAVAKVTPYAVEPEQIAELQVSVLLPIEFKAYEDQFHIQVLSPEDAKSAKL